MTMMYSTVFSTEIQDYTDFFIKVIFNILHLCIYIFIAYPSNFKEFFLFSCYVKNLGNFALLTFNH